MHCLLSTSSCAILSLFTLCLAVAAFWVFLVFISQCFVDGSLGLLACNLRNLHASGCNPEEVVLPKLVNLLEERVEAVGEKDAS